MPLDPLELAPNEEVVFSEDGFHLTEQKEDDGTSLFIIYDDFGNYIDEFVDESLTDEDMKEFEATYHYDTFQALISEFKNPSWSELDRFEMVPSNDAKEPDWDNFEIDDDGIPSYDFTRGSKKGKHGKYWWEKPELTPEQKAEKERKEKELVESLCKSDTIVFHMKDSSTDMLIPIYEGRGWDVYTGSTYDDDGLGRESIHELIRRHDKVMCLGHGTPGGLIGGNIGSAEVPLLKEKKVFALWCYAATFFKKNGFGGQGIFCSDNCPSEVWECRAACDANVSADWILNNMYYLSDCIISVIDLIWDNPEEACRRAKEMYSKSEANTEDEKKVVEFNTNTLQVV